MAVIDKNKREDISSKLKNQYQFTIHNTENLETVWSGKITKLDVLIYASAFAFVVAIIVGLLFIFTPLNYLLPVQQSSKFSRQLVNNVYELDSLKRKIKARDRYFANIQNIMQGRQLENYETIIDTSIRQSKLEFTRSKQDSILRKQIENAEKQTLNDVSKTRGGNSTLKNLHFFKPVKGIVTNKFDVKGKHPAVDIVAELNEPVLATLEGTVIIATWSLNTGYIIQVQHPNNLISVYKHNSSLLKETGDQVKAGEPIALIGNTGELSTGPHLHFELWHNGSPLNPEDYIAF